MVAGSSDALIMLSSSSSISSNLSSISSKLLGTRLSGYDILSICSSSPGNGEGLFGGMSSIVILKCV